MHHNIFNFQLLVHKDQNGLDNLIKQIISFLFQFNSYILMQFFHFIIHILYCQICQHKVYCLYYFDCIIININFQIQLIFLNQQHQKQLFSMVFNLINLIKFYLHFSLKWFVFLCSQILLFSRIFLYFLIIQLIYYQDLKMILFFKFFMISVQMIFLMVILLIIFQYNLYHLYLRTYHRHSHRNNLF